MEMAMQRVMFGMHDENFYIFFNVFYYVQISVQIIKGKKNLHFFQLYQICWKSVFDHLLENISY